MMESMDSEGKGRFIGVVCVDDLEGDPGNIVG